MKKLRLTVMPLVSKYLLKTILLKVKMREALLLVDPIDNHTKGPGHPEGEMIRPELKADVTQKGEGLGKKETVEEMKEILVSTKNDLGQDLGRKRGEGGVDLQYPDLIKTDTMKGIQRETIAEIDEAEALATTKGLDMNQGEVIKAMNLGEATEATKRSKESRPRKFIHTFSKGRRWLIKMTKRSFGTASSG